MVCPTAPRLPRAYILAGGLGLRLRSVVADRPKALAEVGGRPFLDFVIGQIAAHGGMAITLSAFNPRDVLAWHVDPDDAPQEPAAEPKHTGDRRRPFTAPYLAVALRRHFSRPGPEQTTPCLWRVRTGHP